MKPEKITKEKLLLSQRKILRKMIGRNKELQGQ